MGSQNGKIYKSYDGKSTMDENLVNWLIKEFGKDDNRVSRAPGAGFLIKVVKEFGGQKHYYFNIPAFFDPDQGFIMCLFQMYQQYLKKIKEVNSDKFITFVDLLSRPFEFVLSFLGWENDSRGLAILRNLYSMALGIGLGIGINALALYLSRFHPLLGVATIAIFVIADIRALCKIKALEKIEENGNKLFSIIFNNFKSPNFIEILKEINIIEIAIDEKSDSLLSGFFNKGVKINYWNLPIENAKTLNELDERTNNFYCEIVLSMKEVEIKNALYRIETIKRKYDDSYNKGKKNLEDINYCKEELIKLNQTMPNNPQIQNLLKKLNIN